MGAHGLTPQCIIVKNFEKMYKIVDQLDFKTRFLKKKDVYVLRKKKNV